LLKNGFNFYELLLVPMRILFKTFLALAFYSVCLTASAETITISVASNFRAAMDEIIAGFEAETGHTVQVSYGSSGRFFAQINNGAPFDLFFSADQEKPATLEDMGHVVANTRFTYAIGKLVLWSKNPDLNLAGGEILQQGEFNKLALANPRLAPYGVAAIEVLSTMQLEESTRNKWVQGENITQAFQFVDSENADVGFVAYSQLISAGLVLDESTWLIPEEFYTPIRQDAVLLKRGENKQAAIDFLDYVRGTRVREIIESYGYRHL
jgi:molybdate transport system substrate-binding protein